MDLVQIAIGVALAGASYFAYLVATKGLPAAWALAKAKWNAGKAELAKLQGDLATLEQGVVADVKERVAALEAEMSRLKPAPNPVPTAAAAPAAAPAAPLWPAGSATPASPAS